MKGEKQMKNLLKGIKLNKSGLVKGVLVAGGVIAVGLITKAMANNGKDGIELPPYGDDENEVNEVNEEPAEN